MIPKPIYDPDEIEVGDTVRLIVDESAFFKPLDTEIIEGEIQAFDFSIPSGTVILCINDEYHSTSGRIVYLIKVGTRTAEQKLQKSKRASQVNKQMHYLDAGGKIF